MSETKRVSKKCHSEHLLRCWDELQVFKECEVPTRLTDYECQLNYYSGSEGGDYYAMECEGTAVPEDEIVKASGTCLADAMIESPEIDDNFALDQVIYQCSIDFGKIAENLASIFYQLESGSDDKIEVELEASRMREQWQQCKMNAFRLAATRLGSIDRVICSARNADKVHIGPDGTFVIRLDMRCTEKK